MSRLPRLLLLATALVAASRFVCLTADYGLDADGWLVARAAHNLAAGGAYEASRLPGYPVQEFGYALLLKLNSNAGPMAFGLVTALFSVLASLTFGLALRGLGSKFAPLGALALAAVPAVYINSLNAMDFVWSLAWITSAMAAAIHGRSATAGILIGLAIGTRITSGAALLPLSLLLAPNALGRRQLVRMWLTALGTGALCFAPVLWSYGFEFFTYYGGEERSLLQPLFGRALLQVWSPFGLCAASAGLLIGGLRCLHRRGGERAVPADQHPRLWHACLLAMALWFGAFLILPADPDYLIPTVPFALLFLGWLLSGSQFAIFCLLLCIAPFTGWGSETKGPGPLQAALNNRRSMARIYERVLAEAKQLPEAKVVIYAGPLFTQLAVSQQLRSGKELQKGPDSIVVRRRLNPTNSSLARREGYALYALNVPQLEWNGDTAPSNRDFDREEALLILLPSDAESVSPDGVLESSGDTKE